MKIEFEELTIVKINDFYNLISDELKDLENETLVLDFENVEKIDLSNIQLLISLKKYCLNKNIHLQLQNIISQQIKQSFEIYNLNEHLGK